MRRPVQALAAAAFAVAIPAVAIAGSSATAAQKIAAIESTTRQLRGLNATRAVPARILGDAAFNSVLRAEIRRDTPESQIVTMQREDRILGLLSTGDNLRKLLYGAQVKNIIGVYDYITRKLYVRNHANRAFGVDRYVLAHEYTHALQDQHYHLNTFVPDQTQVEYRDSDVVEAHRALVEGDATNVMYLYIQRQYSQDEIRQLVAEQKSEKPPKMPKAMDRDNQFPYTTGYRFAHTLYQKGGMAAVNNAFAHPPDSTYEIMHPAAYLRGWKPAVVSMHTVAGFTSWQQSDNDVLGAHGYDLLWSEFLPDKSVGAALAQFRGDRYVVLTSGASAEILLKSRWTSASAAAAAETVWVSSLRARWRHAAVTRTAQGVTVRAGSHAVYLRVDGTRLIAAYANTNAAARTLANAATS